MARKAKEQIKPIAQPIPMKELVPGLAETRVPDLRALREEEQRAEHLAMQRAEQRFDKKKRAYKATSCAFEDCKFPALKNKEWCDRHINECAECENRCAHDEKYCMVHSCQLCHRRRKIGGMCAQCAQGLGMAQGNHRYNPPALPDNRAMAEAAEVGL